MGHHATPAELAQAALDDDAQLARFRASIGRSCPGPRTVREYDFNGRVYLPRPLLTYITKAKAERMADKLEEVLVRLETAAPAAPPYCEHCGGPCGMWTENGCKGPNGPDGAEAPEPVTP